MDLKRGQSTRTLLCEEDVRLLLLLLLVKPLAFNNISITVYSICQLYLPERID